MRARGIRAAFALGGITSTMVDLHEKGLIGKLLDVQSFDRAAATSLARNPRHIEISANQYANFSSKGASVDRLDVVVLSALEIDTGFNVNVLTGSDGVLRGASGGHCDTAAAAGDHRCAVGARAHPDAGGAGDYLSRRAPASTFW